MYDFRKGRDRVLSLIGQPDGETVINGVPARRNFPFDVGYRCQITAIFVRLETEDVLRHDAAAAKIVRSFTSETIEILNQGNNLIDIGVCGGCVYGVYTTPRDEEAFEILNRAFCVNTLVKMLNTIFAGKGLPSVTAGTGIAFSEDIMLKAGRDRSGVQSKLWIGDAVRTASELSSLGSGPFGEDAIVVSEPFYQKVKGEVVRRAGEGALEWFREGRHLDGTVYSMDIVKKEFDEWIKNGMKD